MDASQTSPGPLLAATGQYGPLKLCGILSALGFAAVTVASFLLYHGHNGRGLILFAIGGALVLGAPFYALRRTRALYAVSLGCNTPWGQKASTVG